MSQWRTPIYGGAPNAPRSPLFEFIGLKIANILKSCSFGRKKSELRLNSSRIDQKRLDQPLCWLKPQIYMMKALGGIPEVQKRSKKVWNIRHVLFFFKSP